MTTKTNLEPPSEQTSTTTPAQPPPSSASPLPAKRQRGRPATEVSCEQRDEIIRLSKFYKPRGIGRRVRLGRKVVERILLEEGIRVASDGPKTQAGPSTIKLAPFQQTIEELARKDLTITRILRTITNDGYQGGRTILADHVRALRTRLTLPPRTPPAKRRFETAPAEEMQIDWSPYLIPIGDRVVQVYALGCLLAYSRKLYLRCYRDERQATLLEGLASAFQYFDGVARRIVLDNMSTAVLGRLSADGKVLWHPRFVEFLTYYGCQPFACRVRDPDRKGKKEKSFRLVWDDFLKGTPFASWDDLDQRRRVWLDETPGVGNCRVHGTTRRVPNEAWAEERPLLIRLPEQRFPVHEQAARIVDRDSTLSIRGTRYTVPAHLASRSVAVRLFAEHFEVLDAQGRVAFCRAYVSDADKGKLIIDPTHYASLPRRPPGAGSGERLDVAFVTRFPALVPLVDGIKLRMKSLAHVHIRALLRACDQYGQDAFLAAATRAQSFRRFDAGAVVRILEQNHPLPDGGPLAPLSGTGPVVLGEVEPSSLDTYAHLDREVASQSDTDTTDPESGHGS
jgi:transposase